MSAKQKAAVAALPMPVVTERPKDAKSTRLAKVIEAVRKSANDSLEGYFEAFLKSASPEEIHIMNRILLQWDQYSHGTRFDRADSPVEREIPILSAFQYEIDGAYLVSVPDEDMVPYVENFIVELGRQWHQVEKANKRSSETDEDQTYGVLRQEIEVFIQDAGTNSIAYMRRLLARWSQLHRDPDVRSAIKGDEKANVLMAAAEIEADRMGAINSVHRVIHGS